MFLSSAALPQAAAGKSGSWRRHLVPALAPAGVRLEGLPPGLASAVRVDQLLDAARRAAQARLLTPAPRVVLNGRAGGLCMSDPLLRRAAWSVVCCGWQTVPRAEWISGPWTRLLEVASDCLVDVRGAAAVAPGC